MFTVARNKITHQGVVPPKRAHAAPVDLSESREEAQRQRAIFSLH